MSFLSELGRRRVLRVVGVYLVTAWVAIQVADVVFPRLGLPGWTVTLVVALAAVGLPVTAALAWAFDITPQGIRRDTGGVALGGGRRAGWTGGAILLGLVGFGVYAYLIRPAGDDGVAADANRIAVIPFEVRAGAELQYLREAFVDLLSAKLNDAGDLTSVDPTALLAHLARSGDAGTIDPRQARDVALRFGAGHFILGSILRIGTQVEIQARLYQSGGAVVATASVTRPEEELDMAVDELARQLLADRLRGPDAELMRAAATAARSLPALKSYLQGEVRLRRGDAEGAVQAFEQAVALDTAFTFAYFRLAVARSWHPRSSAAFAATADAIRMALAGLPGLSERERTLVLLFNAYWFGGNIEAEALAWSILSAQPENLEARYYLAEVLFHGASPRGRDLQESRDAFEHTLALQPDHPHALLHLVDLALARQDAAAIDTLGSRVAVLAPDLAPQVAAYRALLAGGDEPYAALAAALRQAPGEAVVDIAWRATALTRSPAVADAFGRVLVGSVPSPAMRRVASRMSASAAAASGRWDDAWTLLEPELGTTDGLLLAARLLIASASGSGAAPPDALRRVRDLLRGHSAPPRTLVSAVAADDVVFPYLAGRLALLLDDDAGFASALQQLDQLNDRVPPDVAAVDPRVQPAYFVTALRAHQARAQGRNAAAFALLQPPGMPLLRVPEAFLIAELLEAERRTDDAARWYASLPAFDSEVFMELPLAVAAQQRLARLRHGDRG